MSPKDLIDGASQRLEPFVESVYLRGIGRLVMVAVVPVGIVLWTDQLSITRTMQEKMNEQAIEIARLSVSSAALRVDLTDRSADRYTATEASKDWNDQHSRDNRQDERMDAFDGRLRDIEADLRREKLK